MRILKSSYTFEAEHVKNPLKSEKDILIGNREYMTITGN